MKNNRLSGNLSPWFWIPTLYFAEGIPYFVVNNISVTLFKRLGMGNAELAMYTSLLYLPWVIKPLWGPLVDVVRTKRWWILLMQALITAAFATLSLSVSPDAFGLMLVIFYVVAFASATHDIAADGFYMIALDTHRQSAFVGIRSTFYRIASVFGQGVIVVVAGVLEERIGNIPLAWSLTLGCCSVLFAVITVWHFAFIPVAEGGSVPGAARFSEATVPPVREFASENVSLRSTLPGKAGPLPLTVPRAARFSEATPAREAIRGPSVNKAAAAARPARDFAQQSWKGLEAVGLGGYPPDDKNDRTVLQAFGTFFRKPGVLTALLFLLLFRLPEAFSIKMLTPFMLDPTSAGGLGLTTAQSGLVYGTVGVIALTIGGILGGLACAHYGLRRTIMPMALSLALPCAVYLYMAAAQPESLAVIYACVAFDQFGYGFGFTAYMLYMMYFSEGEFKTSHYAVCTAFMALSMMLPGMVAGWLQELVGYVGFFVVVMLCCLCTVAVTLKVRRAIDPKYGLK